MVNVLPIAFKSLELARSIANLVKMALERRLVSLLTIVLMKVIFHRLSHGLPSRAI